MNRSVNLSVKFIGEFLAIGSALAARCYTHASSWKVRVVGVYWFAPACAPGPNHATHPALPGREVVARQATKSARWTLRRSGLPGVADVSRGLVKSRFEAGPS